MSQSGGLGKALKAKSSEASDQKALIAQGKRLFTQSPEAGNPVACATCHFDNAALAGWAASFPKVKPLPPPHTRVMTLYQANVEAVLEHYRLANPEPAATAITAYLTTLGAGVPVSPGIAAGQPVFPERIVQLAASVRRGGPLFASRCGQCHHTNAIAQDIKNFPRILDGHAQSLEAFLEGHAPRAETLKRDGQEVADLMAYIMAQIARQPLFANTSIK